MGRRFALAIVLAGLPSASWACCCNEVAHELLHGHCEKPFAATTTTMMILTTVIAVATRKVKRRCPPSSWWWCSPYWPSASPASPSPPSASFESFASSASSAASAPSSRNECLPTPTPPLLSFAPAFSSWKELRLEGESLLREGVFLFHPLPIYLVLFS